MLFSLLLTASCVVAINEWELLAHGSTRTPYSTPEGNTGWNITSDYALNLIQWAVPFNFGPTLYGGIDQSLKTGDIHIQVCGTNPVDIGQEWPGGGSTKQWGPPLIWQINSNTGDTVRVYNLSDYGATFYSIVRYTPAGNPVVAVCTANAAKDITILVLDTDSDKVLWKFTPSLEPMLLQITNTDPQQLLFAGMYSDGALDFDSNGITPSNSEIVNSDISTIIFGAHGKSIYNNGFSNEATGIYHLDLPLQANQNEKLIVPGCETFPWVITSDLKNNIYAVCNSYNIYSYDSTGKQRWMVKGDYYNQPNWLIINDEETTVISGTTTVWTGFDIESGELWFNTTIAEIKILSDGDDFRCLQSGQPWAPRHPIYIPANRLAILCYSNKQYNIRIIGTENGLLTGPPLVFDKIPIVDMLIADDNNVYGFGYDNKKIAAQKIPMP